jgi:hypothetical protein
MPQVSLFYSNDISVETKPLFKAIETTISQLDSGAGVCKSRAYPCQEYQHSHILLEVLLMKKAHRDNAFMDSCLKKIEACVMKYIPDNCYYSIAVDFLSENYISKKKS